MNGPLEGVRGVMTAAGPAASAARSLLASMGAELFGAPAEADFVVVEDEGEAERLLAGRPSIVVLVLREDGGLPAVVAAEAVAAVVTGLRHAGRTLVGQRIDLDGREAAMAAAGEALMAGRYAV